MRRIFSAHLLIHVTFTAIVHNIIWNIIFESLQVVKVEELARGCLELGFNIKISPGRLAKYTRVSRSTCSFLCVSVNVMDNVSVNMMENVTSSMREGEEEEEGEGGMEGTGE